MARFLSLLENIDRAAVQLLEQASETENYTGGETMSHPMNGTETRNTVRSSAAGHRWGVILPGRDGTHLQPLTRLACGDNRPKQFCPLLGGKTLLAHTRQRIAKAIDPD
ncbi:MAG: hypothetical protein ACRD3S_09785, partial [Terracidiphilus sp.]